jgi:hypothetical protein
VAVAASVVSILIKKLGWMFLMIVFFFYPYRSVKLCAASLILLFSFWTACYRHQSSGLTPHQSLLALLVMSKTFIE